MAVANRSALIEKLYKVLKKHYKPTATHPPATCCPSLCSRLILEYCPHDKAVSGLHADPRKRVSTGTKSASPRRRNWPSPCPARWMRRRSAHNVKRFLHSVFESQYSFDLDPLKKQNLGKTQSDLAKHAGATPFAVSFVTQHVAGRTFDPAQSDRPSSCCTSAELLTKRSKNNRSRRDWIAPFPRSRESSSPRCCTNWRSIWPIHRSPAACGRFCWMCNSGCQGTSAEAGHQEGREPRRRTRQRRRRRQGECGQSQAQVARSAVPRKKHGGDGAIQEKDGTQEVMLTGGSTACDAVVRRHFAGRFTACLSFT